MGVLRDYQREPVDKIVSHLGAGSGTECVRGLLVAACGSGKTVMAAAAAERMIAPSGTILVLTPTLELLAQTLRVWREWAGVTAIIAVCGELPDSHGDTGGAQHVVEELEAEQVPVTTTPAEVDHLTRRERGAGRVLVLCTYASLAVIAKAHTDFHLAPWDLIVVDEAHRTAGTAGDWSRIHDDTWIPGRRRLYMTATPRVSNTRTRDTDVISMDDQATFGPVVHTLTFGEAITRKILAPYRLVISTVTDSEVAALTHRATLIDDGIEAVPTAVLAAQIALVKAVHTYRLGRVLTFHSRVNRAREFALGLRRAADIAAQYPPRWPIQAQSVSGTMPITERAAVLARLRNPGRTTQVVANARLLGEGVDVPALDAVMFTDPRSSVIDVVQAVGRALRMGEDPDKTATIIVPLLITDEESAAAALDGSQYDAVWKVLRALRAHDEDLAEQLDARSVSRWAGEHEGLIMNSRADTPLVEVLAPEAFDRDRFAAAINVRAVDVTTSSWPIGLAAAKIYHAEHGHLDIPALHTINGFAVGRWLSEQRKDHKNGRLAPARVSALEELGIEWNCLDAQWQRSFAAAQNFYRENGHLQVSKRLTGDYAGLGAWIIVQRREFHRGLLHPERVALLEGIGIEWDPRGTQWQQGVDHARRFHSEHGHLDIPVDYVDADGFALGAWLADRFADFQAGQFSDYKVTTLSNLGVEWTAESRWQRGLEAAHRYRDDHGDLAVPSKYTTAEQFALGNWVATQRNLWRQGKLATDQIAALEDLGIDWEPLDVYWQRRFELARAYHERHGHLDIPARYVIEGVKLGGWIHDQRRQYRRRTLSPQRIAAWEQLGIEWNPLDLRWQTALAVARKFHAEHGHLRIARRYKTPDGFALGEWISKQRHSFHQEGLSHERRTALEDLDIEWNVRSTPWQRAIDYMHAFRIEHGHVNIPTDYVTTDGYALGAWLAAQRVDYDLGRLSSRKIAALKAVGLGWSPCAEPAQRGLDAARGYRLEHGHLDPPDNYITPCGFHLGSWVADQRRHHRSGRLPAAQVAALEALNIEWSPRISAWEHRYNIARAYHREHGCLDVPADYTVGEINLARWLHDQRKRHRLHRMPPDQAAALEELGINWRPSDLPWQLGLSAAQRFHAEHGHLRVPQQYKCPEGFHLGNWISKQRSKNRAGCLTAEKKAALEGVGIEWNPRRSNLVRATR